MGKKREKPRNKNFTTTEKRVLAEFVKENTKTLFGKAGHCSQKVEERKNKCWRKAAEALRVAGGPQPREWADVRKKWNELKVHAHKYNQKKMATGGGQVPVDDTFEHVLDALSPQTKFGIYGQESETNPLPSESVQEDSESQDFQESQASLDLIPSKQSTSSSSNNNNSTVLETELKRRPPPRIRSHEIEEELLRIEQEKVVLMKDTLDLQRGILVCLQSLTTSKLLNSLQ